MSEVTTWLARKVLPPLDPPGGKDLCDLGRKEHWAQLEAIVAAFDSFYVHDALTHHHQTTIRDKLDSSFCECCHSGIITQLLLSANAVTYSPSGEKTRTKSSHFPNVITLLHGLLALGLNPDAPSRDGRRPSHLCGQKGDLVCAEALSLCRIDLGAKNNEGRTPEQEARHALHWTDVPHPDQHVEVALLWESVAKTGFPSLAELAHFKQWWAVKNIIRRQALTRAASLAEYKGKDPAEWAEFHGAMDMAQEIRYLLNYFPAWMSNKKTTEALQVMASWITALHRSSQDSDQPAEVSKLADRFSAGGVQGPPPIIQTFVDEDEMDREALLRRIESLEKDLKMKETGVTSLIRTLVQEEVAKQSKGRPAGASNGQEGDEEFEGVRSDEASVMSSVQEAMEDMPEVRPHEEKLLKELESTLKAGCTSDFVQRLQTLVGQGSMHQPGGN